MPLGTVVLLLFFSFPGWAKDAPVPEVMLDCETQLEVPPNTMVMLGNLRVTFDQHIYWKDKEVFLLYGDHPHLALKNSAYMFRVLMALVDAPNTPQSLYDLYEDAWVDKDLDHAVEKSVQQAVLWIRRSFQLVDPSFDQLKTIRRDGYFWSAGELRPDLQTAELTVVSAVRKVIWKGQEVKLTKAQFGMFWMMMQHQGEGVIFERLFRAYSNSELMQKDRSEIIRILAVEAGNIRKAFKAVDPTFNRVESVRGAGYGWRLRPDRSVGDSCRRH